MLIVTGLALVFRCNLPISILLIWISNPVTIPPMVIALYKLGEWMLGNDPSTTAFVFTWEWLNANLSTVYWPILLAGLSCGLIFGMLGYFTVRILWRWKVVSNWETRKRKRLQKLL